MKIIKIKDDVNMKVLFNYGFKLNKDEWYMVNQENIFLKIKPVSREIVVCIVGMFVTHIPGVLHELITDGLTEIIEIDEDGDDE